MRAGVEVVHDGAQALAAVRDRQPDLLILDVMMPEIDGVERCRAATIRIASPTLNNRTQQGESMGTRLVSVCIGLVLVVSACSSSSSDSGESATDAESPTSSAAAVDSASTDTAAPGATTTAAAASTPPSSGGATATVTLENGEVYTFSILCNLEPQEVAGSEILFTAVSNDTPLGFDVTQFGKVGAETGGVLEDIGSITIWDSATYDDVWVAGTVLSQLDGSEFVLALDGSTITGSAMFVEGGDIENLDSAVRGELIAECG